MHAYACNSIDLVHALIHVRIRTCMYDLMHAGCIIIIVKLRGWNFNHALSIVNTYARVHACTIPGPPYAIKNLIAIIAVM